MKSDPTRLWMFAAVCLGLSALLVPGRGTANPTEPFELQNELEAPGDCANCHAFPNAQHNAGEPNYSPMGWQGSMMANAARDPVFWAGVAIAAQDDPTHTEDCIRCHSPRAFLDGRGDATAIGDLLPSDQTGIDCDFCHRLIDDGMTPAGNARYEIDDLLVNGKVPKRGPWSYGGQGPNHPWSDESDLLASSRHCGTCHDVTTALERVDDEGTGMGVQFNEQRTYSEWLNSAFASGPEAESCQDCHMPAAADAAGCGSFEAQDAGHATGARRHELVGANRFMIEVLARTYGSDGSGLIDDAFFDYSIERLDAFVESAASLDVTFPESVDLEVGLPSLPVLVTNESGHKLPSGYSEGRVMWIEVSVEYAETTVYGSGVWDGESIQDDPQLRRYEAIAENYQSGESLHLLLNDHWIVDSRLPPRGLIEDPQTDPVGDRYTPVDGTWPHTDQVEYAFEAAEVEDATPEDPQDDELTIRVRLLYLINTPEYIDFLVDANVSNSAGTDVAEAFDALGGAQPVVFAQAQAQVPVTGLSIPAPGETSTSDGTSSGLDADGSESNDVSDGSEGETSDDEMAGDGAGCGCALGGPDGARSGTGSRPTPLWQIWPVFTGLALVRRRRPHAA